MVTGHGEPITAATIKTASGVEAEKAAITLAILDKSSNYTLSDSKRAVTNFMMGFFGLIAANILKIAKHSNTIQLLWVPAHAGDAGNEAVHLVARGLKNQEVDHSAMDHLQEGITTYYSLL